MLWSPTILVLLAGAAFATSQNGWKDGKEYTYKIRSRTLAAFNLQSKQFSGILIEGYLTVQPNGQDILRAKISQPRYSQIHTRLDNGWESEIPQNLVNLQTFPLSNEPFEIKTKNGVVRDLIVNRDVPTWEVNVLKSIVSQLQVDTQGENAENSKHNQLPEGEQPYALFKTMEDTVSGKCEVLYDISPLPEHVLQNKPELAPMPELREDGDIISLVKTKNYSNCDQRICYHFGLNGRNKWEPGSNDNGKYLSRSTVSRVVISGNLKRYAIQSSVTTNKIMHSADYEDNQQGMVASKMNLTLHEVKDTSDQISAPSNPQSTGNLVYSYNNPFENSSSRRPNKLNQDKRKQKQNNNRNSYESSDRSSSDSSDSTFDNDDDNYLQPRPKLMEPPYNPMLPLFIGNYGNSVQKNNKIDPVKSAKNIAQQIGNEMQRPDSMPQEQTLERFTILSSLIRMMKAEQIAEVQRSLYEQPQSSNQLNQGNQGQNARRSSWIAFRDAVAQAATGPALVNIKQWIQNKQIKGNEAAQIVDVVAKSARTPTPEYMDTYFEMATMQETKEQSVLRDAAILSFSDLIRHVAVNKQTAHNRYPVHAFGRLFSDRNRNVQEKYIPYMAEELKAAIENGDSVKIQVYTTAIGKTGHVKMLSVFEPYLEGRKQVSPYQRLVMVLSLDKLAEIKPKTARSVLYKIYSNNADYHEIRTAAVYLLMKTNPPASMLQRMAEYTNYDSNKHVNSAVKSTIQSLAQLRDNENVDISNAARSAQPLLTSENYGPQYSRAAFLSWKNPVSETGLFFEANDIGSDDSIIPKGVYVSNAQTFKGIRVPKIEFGGTVSNTRSLWNFMQQLLIKNKKNNNNQKAQEQMYSPENIAKLLGIHGNEPEQVEGFVFANGKYGNHFLAFDNHSLEKIPEQLNKLAENMKQGKDFEETRFNNHEITMSFPTETGFPFRFTVKVPILMSINGNSKLRTDSDSDNQSAVPKSAAISGKIRIIFGMEIQKRLGFVAPFEHQEYIAGVDRNVQVHLPVRSEIEYDKNKQQVRVKIEPNESELEFNIFQYKTQPFTSKHDILSLEPVSKDKNTHVINKDRVTSSQIELNDQNNKQVLKFNWERQTRHLGEENENRGDKRQSALNALNKLAHSISSLYYPSTIDTSYQKYSVKLSSSGDNTAEMKLSYDSLTTESDNNADDSEHWSPNAKAPHLEQSLNERERKQKLLLQASKNINSAKAEAVDISVQLNGAVQSSFAITAAVANSNVDQKSRALLYTYAKVKDGQDYHFSVGLEGKIPNVQSLDYEETLKANSRREFDSDIHYGKGNNENNQNGQNRLKIQGKVKLTEERKNEIRQSRDAQLCVAQVKQNGNKLSSACQKTNQRAASANSGEVNISFENESTLKQMAMSALDFVERISQNLVETQKTRKENQDENKIKIAFEMLSNDDKVDVTVQTPEGKLQFNNIKWNPNSNENNGNIKESRNKQNPEFTLSQDNVCSLDKTQAITFDNRRYSLQVGQCWHVAMTSYPKNDADMQNQQLQIPESMHVSILTKENENGNKELKITLGEKVLELLSSAPHQISAKVNGQRVQYSRQMSYQEKQNGKVVFEIFELPDRSVKLVSDKYSVKVVYDGVRAQIQAGERYRDSVRGLCGNYDGEPQNDQQTPKGCLLQKPWEFSATYAITNDNQCQGPARQNAENAKTAPCTFESARPGNVISDHEAGRQSQQSNKHGDNDQESGCTKHRTMVTRTELEICFSLRPVPSCSSRCNPNGMKTKSIQFHCVARNSASEKVAQRVQKGANPDLSQKTVSKVESHQVPLSCTA